MAELNRIPLFPLDVVLFPEIPLPLHIFEDRYKRMINECLENDSVFGVALFADQKIYNVGCTARIVSVLKKYKDGRMDILAQGVERFYIENISEEKPYLEADIEFLPDDSGKESPVSKNLREDAIEFLKKIIHASGQQANLFEFEEMNSMELSYLIAAYGWFTTLEKQELLEFEETGERLQKELELSDTVIQRLEFNKRLTSLSQTNGRLLK